MTVLQYAGVTIRGCARYDGAVKVVRFTFFVTLTNFRRTRRKRRVELASRCHRSLLGHGHGPRPLRACDVRERVSPCAWRVSASLDSGLASTYIRARRTEICSLHAVGDVNARGGLGGGSGADCLVFVSSTISFACRKRCRAASLASSRSAAMFAPDVLSRLASHFARRRTGVYVHGLE